ncbi:MAG: hypothetical protein ACE5JL_13940, partial [Dehalococcoidia bacterium]
GAQRAIAGFDRRRPDVITCPGKDSTLSGIDGPSMLRRKGDRAVRDHVVSGVARIPIGSWRKLSARKLDGTSKRPVKSFGT